MKKNKKEEKNNKKLLVVIAIILLLSVVGLTLAYFVGQIGSGATANINVTTATVDTLTFTTGADINIGPVTQQNFASGAGNKSGSTTATAMLRANNTTNTANETYNLYVNITNNTFQKTSENAELILTITNPAGNPVTSLTGLTYTTVGGVSGFDVTEKSGLIQIASDYTITVPNASSNPKTDTWNITLTFVNLDADQTDNAGASFAATAIIQKEAYTAPAFTGTIYRCSTNIFKNGYNMNGETTTAWCPTQDGYNGCEDDWYYETESECTADIEEGYTCEAGTVVIPSIGEYTTDASTISNDIYLQHEVTNNIVQTTQLCLKYNNRTFCMGPNYWNTDGATTKNKLQTAMESALGTSADSCDSDSDSALCDFGDFSCYADSNGRVGCGGDGTSCGVSHDGTASCAGGSSGGGEIYS